MRREDAFEVEGTIVEVLPKQVFRVELPNRHRLLGFLPRQKRSQAARLAAGDKVMIELSPCDLSKGRIVPKDLI